VENIDQPWEGSSSQTNAIANLASQDHSCYRNASSNTSIDYRVGLQLIARIRSQISNGHYEITVSIWYSNQLNRVRAIDWNWRGSATNYNDV